METIRNLLYAEIVRDIYREFGASDIDECMRKAAADGKMANICACKEFGATDFDGAFIEAVKNNRLDAVTLLFVLGARDIPRATECAAKRGYLECVKFLVQLNGGKAPNDNELITAADNHHIAVVEYLINSGCDKFVEVALSAVERDDVDMLKLAFSYYPEYRFDEDLLSIAASKGSIKCFKYHIVAFGVRNIYDTFRSAIMNGHTEIVGITLNVVNRPFVIETLKDISGYDNMSDMVKFLENHFEKECISAIENNDKDVIDCLITHKVVKPNKILLLAIEKNNADVVKMLMKYDIKNLNEAFLKTVELGNTQLPSLLHGV